MKKRRCPCCNKKISIKHFFKQMLFKQNKISFIESEKGLICQKCDKVILSAEKKASMFIFIMPISMIPLILIGLGSDASSFQEHVSELAIGFMLSFVLLSILTYRKYQNTDFICNDKSSKEYDNYSIHG
ncbi:MAG: hypothetical protein U9N11_07590 [Campylobacterota bacterium]|nr:hypothetical protein [Campylobacterota bacterium]